MKNNEQYYVIRFLTDPDGYGNYDVTYKGEVVFTWYDGSNLDYPEDLTWDRRIFEVFRAGVNLGRKIEKDQNEQKNQEENSQ